jgi:hypothetical protein
MDREEKIQKARTLAREASSGPGVTPADYSLAAAIELLCDAMDTTRRIPIARTVIREGGST